MTGFLRRTGTVPRAAAALSALLVSAACSDDPTEPGPPTTSETLSEVLATHGFTGTMESRLEVRLGRPLDPDLVDLGRSLFFDRALGLHSEGDGSHGNSCAGCHSPSAGFGDTQPIAIGVDNNGVVGPGREGPRNQRRSPGLTNIAFVPRLMWDGRFFAPSGDPFDNSMGFTFPDPEGTTAFPANDPLVDHLLVAQAHIPPTELPEMTGFTGTSGTAFRSFTERMRLPASLTRRSFATPSAPPRSGSATDVFDDGHGRAVPATDETGFRNDAVRAQVVADLDAIPAYRDAFAAAFSEVAEGGDIEFSMLARALAEFQLSLTFMDAPVDRFARGDEAALTEAQKRGGLLFFGKAGCVGCHAVSGEANEMFSDFQNHRIGVPPLAPEFGPGLGNVEFTGGMEDLGAEHSTGDPSDRYAFRTPPLRNAAVQPHFFHNGSFDRLEAAIRHHLDVVASANGYDAAEHGVPADLRVVVPPMGPVLADLAPALQTPIDLTESEFADLLAFVRDGLLDDRVLPENLCNELPAAVPSGMSLMTFEGC